MHIQNTCVTTQSHQRGHPELWAARDVLSYIWGASESYSFSREFRCTSYHPSVTLTKALITLFFWLNTAGFGALHILPAIKRNPLQTQLLLEGIFYVGSVPFHASQVEEKIENAGLGIKRLGSIFPLTITHCLTTPLLFASVSILVKEEDCIWWVGR